MSDVSSLLSLKHHDDKHILNCTVVQDLQQDFSVRLQAAKVDADAKNVEIVAELDKFRRAFTGDPLGWAAATDEQGKPYYYNSETGESLNPQRGCLVLQLRVPNAVRTESVRWCLYNTIKIHVCNF